jgi:Tfp pilus assembly protein PilW
MGRSPEQNQSDYRRRREIAGVSLLEVLVGLLLASIVTVALYELFASQQRTYSLQDDVSEMQQNLRVAIERMSRDLIMAGFGKPAWSTINNNDLSAWYNSANAYRPVRAGTSLDIVGCPGTPDATIASMDLTSTPMTITLNKTASEVDKGFNTTTRSDISIGGCENVKIVGVAENVLTVDPKPSKGYAPGTDVFVVRHTTYSTGISGGVPVLLINEHLGAGQQTLCQFITSLAVAVNGNVVTAHVVGRTRNPDRTTGNHITSIVSTNVVLRNR